MHGEIRVATNQRKKSKVHHEFPRENYIGSDHEQEMHTALELGSTSGAVHEQQQQSTLTFNRDNHGDFEFDAGTMMPEQFTGGNVNEESDVETGLMTVQLMRHQRIALEWMVKREQAGQRLRGGILADYMGLGKTISCLALILKNRSPRPSQNCGRGGTLVVCPTSLLRQWASEVQTKIAKETNLTFLLYHGANRKKHGSQLEGYDVVITTYAIVALENPKKETAAEGGLGFYGGELTEAKCKERFRIKELKRLKKRMKEKKGPEKKLEVGPLGQIKWFRVVLDEAQCIRNATTAGARAIWGLDTERTWCLSGTPVQNRIVDLYSYFRFLKCEPYNSYARFHNDIKRYIDQTDENNYYIKGPDLNDMPLKHKLEVMQSRKNSLKLVRSIFEKILLRRTKTTLIAGQPLLNLPPRIVRLQEVQFTEEEHDSYLCLHTTVDGD